MPPQLLTDLLSEGLDSDPAVLSGGSVVSFGELRETVNRLTGSLVGQGLGPGERVLVILPNGPAYAAALLSVWRAGGVVVPVDPRIPAQQALRIAADCAAAGILCDAHAFAKLEAGLQELPSMRIGVVDGASAGDLGIAGFLPYAEACAADEVSSAVERSPGDLALLAYTSGSTGRPKGVMHSHESLVSSLVFTRDHLAIVPGDRVLISVPMYHLFALRNLLVHLMVGATVIAEGDLIAGLRRAGESGANVLLLVPAACQLLVQRFASVLESLAPSVKRVSIGSAAIAPAVLDALQALLPKAEIHLPYGMTEARIGFLEAVPGRTARRIRAIDPNLGLDVRDESGAPVESGIGEIVLSGKALMMGYWHQTEEERAALHAAGLRTRDLMEVTPEGRFLVGRLDDVISVGGEKVFPLEVEMALRGHPRVRDAHAFGVEDPRGVLGQVVKASVVLAEEGPFDPEEILAHCRANLEPYKVPQVLDAVPEIARNAVGKIVAKG